MVFTIFTILFVIFLIISGWLARRIVRLVDDELTRKLAVEDESYRKYLDQKIVAVKKRKELESESAEIFTLYEMTKDIVVAFNEAEALQIFKNKIAQHVRVEQCEFFEMETTAEMRSSKKDAEHCVFTLQGKNSKLGYLDFIGIHPDDKEKAAILVQQFALALRRVRLREEIERLAITDSLTEVYTRRYVLERFNEDIKRSKHRNMQTSLLMIDVDFFKKYNDDFGHLVGDRILREIGQIIKTHIREIDIAGRYGGEEFCVVLPDTDKDGAAFVAERIRAAAEQAEIDAYDARINVTLSIGTSSFPKDGKTIDELVDKADWALYRAKKIGRNKVCAFGVYEDSV
ncbi:MAG: GGDEF domain-containing protein [Candidatus Omnitrophica bacterium]|nr:GGDEF domain-containing protein [Candidatus Omnitrophota bacterium]